MRRPSRDFGLFTVNNSFYWRYWGGRKRHLSNRVIVAKRLVWYNAIRNKIVVSEALSTATCGDDAPMIRHEKADLVLLGFKQIESKGGS